MEGLPHVQLNTPLEKARGTYGLGVLRLGALNPKPYTFFEAELQPLSTGQLLIPN